MKKRLIAHTTVCWLMAAGTTNVLGIASAQDAGDANPTITRVVAGTDYLQTGPGTQATLPIGGQMVTVQFKGIPIVGPAGPLGNTDTIVQRSQDAVFGAADASPDATITIPITMTALNMVGSVTGPGGANCTVTLTLEPTPASTGTLTLTTNAANTGGTYTSEVTVHFIATFTPGLPTCYKTTPGVCKFRQKGGKWSIKPQPGEYLVTGPYGDLQANQHTPLAPGLVDFYISKAQTDTAATATHATCEALAAAGTPCPTTKQ